MKERYEGIDGLKAYAILGIALMHILSNGNFGLNGLVFQKLIPSFTNLVFLFMMVSGFGMCLRLLPEIQGSENRCGRVLYQKIQQDLAIFRITLCA